MGPTSTSPSCAAACPALQSCRYRNALASAGLATTRIIVMRGPSVLQHWLQLRAFTCYPPESPDTSCPYQISLQICYEDFSSDLPTYAGFAFTARRWWVGLRQPRQRNPLLDHAVCMGECCAHATKDCNRKAVSAVLRAACACVCVCGWNHGDGSCVTSLRSVPHVSTVPTMLS